MTSHGQMALRRRVGRPDAVIRSVVMGLQCTRAPARQQCITAGIANLAWTVA